MKSAKQAMENMEYVHRLLEQKQPGFAASLEFAVSLAGTSMEKPMDDELIRLCAAAADVACLWMTTRYLSWSRPEPRRRKHSTARCGSVGAQTRHQGVLDLRPRAAYRHGRTGCEGRDRFSLSSSGAPHVAHSRRFRRR